MSNTSRHTPESEDHKYIFLEILIEINTNKY